MDLNDFWSGLRNTFTTYFQNGSSGSQGYNSPDPMGETGSRNVAYSPQAASNNGWGDTFKSIGHEAAPGLAQLGFGAITNAAFPSKGAKVIGLDPRTAQGAAAENLRLGNASAASDALGRARKGELDPFMEQQVRKRSRAADAARGMLETGGSGVRENNAVQEEVNRTINREAGNVSTMTSGYTPQAFTQMPAQENPWAKLFTAALAPAVGKGGQRLYDRWAL